MKTRVLVLSSLFVLVAALALAPTASATHQGPVHFLACELPQTLGFDQLWCPF